MSQYKTCVNEATNKMRMLQANSGKTTLSPETTSSQFGDVWGLIETDYKLVKRIKNQISKGDEENIMGICLHT
jgi:hypothetical protein